MLAYPNSYAVGMSSLGFQRVFNQMAEWPDTVCERAFMPEADELAWRRKAGKPVVTLDGGRPLRNCDLLAFSISNEYDYVNALNMMRLSGIEPRAADRTDDWPLVIAGGLCVTSNPMPLAQFIDAIVIGESEPTLGPLLDTIKSMGSQGVGKKRLLKQLATLPGIYVPSIHSSKSPKASIMRQWASIESLGARSVITTPSGVFGEMVMFEIARGCPFNCRFCLPGYAYLPYRECRMEDLTQILRSFPENARIGFVACSPDSHPSFREIIDLARDAGHEVSIGSQRAEHPSQLGEGKFSGTTLTIAPETGADGLRKVIGKSLRNEAILNTVASASDSVSRIRMYFIYGFPFETDEDRAEISSLVAQVRACTKLPISVSINPFIPKPWTAFQWSPLASVNDLRKWRDEITKDMRAIPSVEVRFLGAREAHIQALLSRGDHRVGEALLNRLDGDGWPQAFQKAGIDMNWVFEPLQPGTTFEWDFINMGFGHTRLAREYNLAQSTNQARFKTPEKLSDPVPSQPESSPCP